MFSMRQVLKNRFKAAVKAILTSPFSDPVRPLTSSQLVLECLENRVLLASYIWVGPEDGAAAGTWATPGPDVKYWQDTATGSRVSATPGQDDTVKFNNLSTKDCTVAAATTIGTIVIDGYTKHLVLDQILTVKTAGSLKTTTPNGADYTIAGNGDFVIASGSTFTWNSGTMAGVTSAANIASGKTIVSAGATLTIASDTAATKDARLAGRELKNDGTVNFTSGQIYLQDAPGMAGRSASITNAGTFNISGTAASIYAGHPAKFANKTSGKVTLNLARAVAEFTVSASFDNEYRSITGAVSVTKGRLVLTGGGKSTGDWRVEAGQQIRFEKTPLQLPAPAFTWGMDTRFFGEGTVVI